MKAWWKRNRPKYLARFVFFLTQGIFRTFRLKVEGESNLLDGEGGKIVSSWHGRSIIPAYHLRRRGIWALFSLSNDGELQSRFFSLLGFQMIRGSTGRGGERAAIEAIRVLRKGETLALTPDGPRGPAGVVQGGILLMAKKSGAAIIPMGASANPRWLIRSWDRYLIPRPFSRASLVFGEPIFVAEDADEAQLAEIGNRLAEAMNRLQEEAEKRVGIKPELPSGATSRSDS